MTTFDTSTNTYAIRRARYDFAVDDLDQFLAVAALLESELADYNKLPLHERLEREADDIRTLADIDDALYEANEEVRSAAHRLASARASLSILA